MATCRLPGSCGRTIQLPWEDAIDDGTMCRQRAPFPGFVGGPTIRQPRCPFECRVETEPSGAAVMNELLIMDAAEWAKFLAASISPAKDTVTDLREALTKLGINGKATIRVIKGREYVVIAGYPGLRKILNAPKYSASNVKVAKLVIGTARLGKSAVKGTVLSIVLVSAADVLEAVLNDKSLLEKELGFTILVDVSKAAISGIVGFLSGAALVSMGAPVILPIAAGIIIGIVVGKVLDSEFPTDKIVQAMTEYYDGLTESIMSQGARFLRDIERQILWQVWPHGQIPFPAY